MERRREVEGVVVRRATERDARGIALVHVDTWRAAYAGLLPASFLARLSVDAREVGWRTALRDPAPGSSIRVALRGARCVGFVSVGPSREPDGAGLGEVYAIYVDPSEWGTGVGGALMEQAIDDLRGAGFDAATLWVFDDNPRARRFYERYGWRADGARQELDVEGTKVWEVRYRLELAGSPPA